VAAIAVLGVVVAVVCVRLALFPDGGPPGEAGDGDLAPDSGIVIEDLEPGADGLAPVAGPGEEDVGGGESGGGGTAIVHVAGAVAHPGIVEVPSDARVHDAVTAAGGALAQADLEAVNLARAVVDGERIYIPLPGQTPPDVLDTGPSSGAGGEPGGGGSGGGSGDALVDVNTADAAALDSLPGIGPVLAGRIVAYRDKNGPFADVEALTDVPGIGPAILENVRDLVRVG
jgi:competence protein ComEA